MKTLLYFSSSWCGPCKMFGPIMDIINSKGMDVTKINVDDDPESAMKYGIRNVPTVVLLKDGIEVDRRVGVQSEIQITNWYNQF